MVDDIVLNDKLNLVNHLRGRRSQGKTLSDFCIIVEKEIVCVCVSFRLKRLKMEQI